MSSALYITHVIHDNHYQLSRITCAIYRALDTMYKVNSRGRPEVEFWPRPGMALLAGAGVEFWPGPGIGDVEMEQNSGRN